MFSSVKKESDSFLGKLSTTEKIVGCVGIIKASFPIGKKIYEKFKEETTYTISVGGGDEIYEDLHTWLLDYIPEKKKHSLQAVSEDKKRYYEVEEDEETKKDKVTLFFSGSRPQNIHIEGHRIKVSIWNKIPDGIQVTDIPNDMRSAFATMTFTTNSIAGKDALVRHLNNVMVEKRTRKNKPTLKVLARWNEWITRNDLPPRRIDSVLLKEGQLEGILGDFADFLGSELLYNRLSLSWHRGYLFHGPAGTGKSSIAKALANHFGLSIFYLPLGDIKNDTALNNAFSVIKPRSLLLLEDIDIFHAAKERNDNDQKVSLSGLLNALDGINTPHGLITIMTTNNLEALDPALIRAGRVDRKEEFGYLDFYQFKNMVKWFYDKDIGNELIFINELKISPATVVDIFAKNKSSYEDGIAAITEYLINAAGKEKELALH